MHRKLGNSVLRRVYLLVALQLTLAVIAMAAVYWHTQHQHEIYDRIGNFHGPSTYYADKLTSTLETLLFNLALNKATPEKISVSSPLYSIRTDLAFLSGLARQTPDSGTQRALQNLQKAAKTLMAHLERASVANGSLLEPLTIAATATRFRAEQLSRLHVNSSERLRKELVRLNQQNVQLMAELTLLAILIGTCLIVPLILNIRTMVFTLQNSEKTQRALKEAAELEKQQMTALLTAMNIGVMFEDKSGAVDFFNPAFIRIWGIDTDGFESGLPVHEVLRCSTTRFTWPEHASKHVLQVVDTHESSERFEIELNDGRVVTQLSFPVLSNDKGLMGRLWIYEDITHERQTAQQLLYLAEHDPLTGLYNRHRFQQHLDYMIKSALRHHRRFALLYFDLDEFKYINDTFGHGAGDTVLIRAASEIGTLVRDVEIFARLGGDEFGIILLTDADENISVLPQRILNTIASIPIRLRGSNLRLTASIGVALYPEHGVDTEDLVAHADAAMYQAKRQGKNTWALYNPDADNSESMVERMSWSRRIGLALENDLFELHFQGVYKTKDQVLSHMEVLVRMRDPADNSRLIMPGFFIPFAEKTGQIIEIDRWVLAKSIALLAEYPTMAPLAVNISGRSFDEPGLPNYIKNKLNEHRVIPSRLIIELTETETVSDLGDAQRFIESINLAGCRVCLDDFGSGFSTFTYLKYLNVDILKIDGLFVRDLPHNRENQLFVQAMCSIAGGLNKAIIAEFVEDSETMILLKELGVDYVQGYYLDRPANHQETMRRLALNKSVPLHSEA